MRFGVASQNMVCACVADNFNFPTREQWASTLLTAQCCLGQVQFCPVLFKSFAVGAPKKSSVKQEIGEKQSRQTLVAICSENLVLENHFVHKVSHL